MNDRAPKSIQDDVDGFSPAEWERYAREVSDDDARRLSSRAKAFRSHQERLRRRATAKFPLAGKMLFAETLLQQASSLAIGRYKAKRFAGVGRVADLCCGLGGDLIALAEVAEAVGVDRSPVAALLARWNLAACGLSAEVIEGSVEAFDLSTVDVWHVDPDRRNDSAKNRASRTVHLESFSPDVDWLRAALRSRPEACVKLAPATPLEEDLAALGTREWIGAEGETKQQLLWTGRFREENVDRAATLVDDEGRSVARFDSTSGDEEECGIAEGAEAFVCEPHSALLSAKLAEPWAASQGLSRIAVGVEYFVGPSPIDSPWCACFAVEDELPFDRRKLKAYLRERNVGTLEIKVRRAKVVPEELRKELKVAGDASRTLLIYAEPSGRHGVLVARRLASSSERGT